MTDLGKLSQQWEAEGGALAGSSLQKALADFGHPNSAIQERMKALADAAAGGSALQGVAQRLANQHRTLEEMASKAPPRFPVPELPTVKFPPNPIHETNEQLKKIGDRVDQMQDVAIEAAKIATGLQASAAEFLQKFEKAVSDSDVNTRRGFRISTGISVVALIIAVATPFIQARYDEPDSGPVLQAAIEEVQAELAALREAEVALPDRLAQAIDASDQETTAILRDIRNVLSESPVANPKER